MKKVNKNRENTKKESGLGYTVPSNYFEDFQKDILHKIAHEKLAENHQDKLGFILPSNYFETVNEQILSNSKAKKGKVISFLSSKKWLISSVAASIAFLLIFNFVNNSKLNDNHNITANKTITEMDSIIAENDAILGSILVEDTEINAYIDTYLIEELLIKDALTNFLSLDDVTLAGLFVEESNVDEYVDEYVLENLIINNIQSN